MGPRKELIIDLKNCPLLLKTIADRREGKQYVVLKTRDGQGICLNSIETAPANALRALGR